jgi:uncharacterized membrane protein
MRREEFLAALKRALGGMSEHERREILYDYEEHFRMGMAEGRTEEQIARSLGNPRVIGKSYAIDVLLEEPREGGLRAASVVRAVFASVSLTFFNLIFILGPFLGLVGVMIGLWAGAAALPLSGLVVFLSPLVNLVAPGFIGTSGLSALFLLFAGVAVTALGLLAVLGMWKLSGLFIRMIAAYVRFNARVISRRR